MIYSNVTILLNDLLIGCNVSMFKYSNSLFTLYFNHLSRKNKILPEKLILSVTDTMKKNQSDSFFASIITKIILEKKLVSYVEVTKESTIIYFDKYNISINNLNEWAEEWELFDIKNFKILHCYRDSKWEIICDNNHFYVKTPIDSINTEYINKGNKWIQK